ncbi:MAG TPA: RsmE family RNA methyltransferase [Anaerolineaceae bacterium]|nr:RsmE family RNA methyltransferase [Anaerolineaceae bacterium]HPN51625.1 RsmE family RNA methyltransferase [Anaerolineaceae bacterium]
MHRFFVSQQWISLTEARLEGDAAHQAARVLRLRPGEVIQLLDGSGEAVDVRLEEVMPGLCRGVVLGRGKVTAEPQKRLGLYLCLAQREKFEWMLQKCTEVGAAEFTPVISSRSLVQEGSGWEKKQPRWQRIIQEAAEQSGRGRVPLLRPPMPYPAALADAAGRFACALLAWEGEQTRGLRAALKGADSAAVFIGPEGGFSEAEAAQAAAAGLQAVSLGRRILRMETAAVAAAVLVMDELEG